MVVGTCSTLTRPTPLKIEMRPWTCLNRPGLPLFEEGFGEYVMNQWIIGYQYFGGITNWRNLAFPDGIPSRSRIKLAQSRPGWCLAADAVMKVGGFWGGGIMTNRASAIFDNLPPHRNSHRSPTGGNEVFADGSARWVKFEEMYFLTTWPGALNSRQAFFYQDPNDFDPDLATLLPTLAGPVFQ